MKISYEDFRGKIEEMAKEGYTYLIKITAVDYGDHLEAVYMLRNIDAKKEEVVKVDLPEINPAIPSIIDIYTAADWYERELSEMFGIKVEGRDMKKLLLEKWDGVSYPLRKSFVWGTKYESES